MLSLPGDFLLARLLMALLGSSSVGGVSSSSITGRSGMAARAASVMMFCVAYSSRAVLYPALKLLGLVRDYLSCLRLEGGGLAGGWACRFLDALIHPSRVPGVSSGLNTAAEVQPVGVGAVAGGLLGRFPGSLEVGERGGAWCGLVGQQRIFFASVTGSISSQWASNQSAFLRAFFP